MLAFFNSIIYFFHIYEMWTIVSHRVSGCSRLNFLYCVFEDRRWRKVIFYNCIIRNMIPVSRAEMEKKEWAIGFSCK